MLAANYTSVRNNLKEYCDKVYDENETLIVTRKEERNVVMMSLDKYNEMERIINNLNYLAKLAESDRQVKEGRVITRTIEELEEMAKE